MTAIEKPNYGIDAPGVARNLLVAGLICLALGLLEPSYGFHVGSVQIHFPRGMLLGPGIGMTAGGLFMVWGSKVGKFQLRNKILAAARLSATDHVLDVGCGHGLLMIGAAKQLEGGMATGIDLWSNVDQGGNSAEATRQNAELEGVATRTEILTGNACELPFPDNHFDAVVSNWVIHNIPSAPDREKAIREAVRVLKPGGRLVVSDIAHVRDYTNYAVAAGAKEASTRWLPLYMTSILTASK